MSTATSELPGGTWTLGDATVTRLGYGAMRLTGPGVMGPPADREAALAVLREAVERGVTHLDTSHAYGPGVTNALIRKALHPYPESLVIATKVGAVRDEHGGWPTARRPEDLRAQVRQNLESLGTDVLDLVYLRVGDARGRVEEPVGEAVRTLAELREEGLIRRIGISDATPAQVEEARSVAPVVSVQNLYHLAHREDDALIDRLAAERVAYVPYFPLGGFTPLQSEALRRVARRAGTGPLPVALAWLLRRSPNILLIPGTSSVIHLRENIAGAGAELTEEDLAELDAIGR